MLEVLVTGGAGFIGSNLALRLEELGHSITVVDNLSSGTRSNLSSFRGNFIETDISYPFNFNHDFDAIFHMAAITDPRYRNGREIYEKNVNGFKLMLDLARKNNARLVYASTANLYGNGPIPMRENQKKKIITAYGKSKLQIDKIASTYFRKMHIAGLRYFNVFGPRESAKGRAASMIYHLYKAMKVGKNPRLFKFGEQKRDHIYVKDVVDATIMALDAPSDIYNIGTGVATSFNYLVALINEILGTNLHPGYFDIPYNAKSYQANTQADTRLAEKKLGFKARYSLKEGVKDYITWLEEESHNL